MESIQDVIEQAPKKKTGGRPKGYSPTKVKLEKEKEARKIIFQQEHPNFDETRSQVALPDVVVTPINSAEVLVGAVNKVIELYNKIAESITDADIQRLQVKEKINALQKLSYLHSATKKAKAPNMNFIRINTNNKTVDELESALLNIDNDSSEEE